MQFKSISSFIDIYYLEKPFQNLLLNYEKIPQDKLIVYIKKIDITTLSYEASFSKLIYFAQKVILNRDKNDFDKAFAILLEMIDNLYEYNFDHELSYILGVLLFRSIIYKINIYTEINSYKQKFDNVEEYISSNTLLFEESKTLLERIYFFYHIGNLFLYEYGFNLRNELVYRNGFIYLDKQYSDISFYVLLY